MARWTSVLTIAGVLAASACLAADTPPQPAPAQSAPAQSAPPQSAPSKVPATPPAATPSAQPSGQDPNQPGLTHERLKYYVGDWRFTMTHMLDAKEPQISEGTAHCEEILGGRFFQTVTKATMGTWPFEALTIFGFDNVTGEYFNMWFDNTTTGALVSRGRLDEDETLLLTGRFADPKLGEVPYRLRTTVTGPDSYEVEMFVTIAPSTEEQKVMDASYTRVKP